MAGGMAPQFWEQRGAALVTAALWTATTEGSQPDPSGRAQGPGPTQPRASHPGQHYKALTAPTPQPSACCGVTSHFQRMEGAMCLEKAALAGPAPGHLTVPGYKNLGVLPTASVAPWGLCAAQTQVPASRTPLCGTGGLAHLLTSTDRALGLTQHLEPTTHPVGVTVAKHGEPLCHPLSQVSTVSPSGLPSHPKISLGLPRQVLQVRDSSNVTHVPRPGPSH